MKLRWEELENSENTSVSSVLLSFVLSNYIYVKALHLPIAR